MADITSTQSSPYYQVEQKVYGWVMNQHDPRWKDKHHFVDPSMESLAAIGIASEMVKVFSKVLDHYQNNMLTRGQLVEWLMQFDATPMEMSELIEEIDANKSLTYDILNKKWIRGTGE